MSQLSGGVAALMASRMESLKFTWMPIFLQQSSRHLWNATNVACQDSIFLFAFSASFLHNLVYVIFHGSYHAPFALHCFSLRALF